MSTLLDYDDLCQRYGLSRRYVRATPNKRNHHIGANMTKPRPHAELATKYYSDAENKCWVWVRDRCVWCRIDEPHFYEDAIYHIGKTEPTERPQCIFEHDIYRIKSWAKQAGIYEHSTVQAQVLKGVSEMGELADAFIKGDLGAAEDAYGDVIVCLVNAAYMQGINIADAFAKVADIVTARKGRMVAGGAFVKD